MSRREFITLVGYLSAGSPGQIAHLLGTFREGKGEAGYVEAAT